jgi:hypothetical protein
MTVPKGKMPAIDKSFMQWAQQVLEELGKLNIRMEQFESKQEMLSNGVKDRLEQMGEKIQSIEHILTGNGTPERGILIRVDRLEQKNIEDMAVRIDRLEQREKSRIWLLRASIAASLAAIAEGIGSLFKGH